METQNLVISFDYSWFLAKNLAYAECPIMKFQYWNSSTKNQRYLLLDATRSSYFFWKVSENLSLFLTSGPQEAIMETSCLVFWTCLYVFISKYGICIPFDLESWQWNVWISPYMSVTWPSLVGICRVKALLYSCLFSIWCIEILKSSIWIYCFIALLTQVRDGQNISA